jgi:RNA polymerase sigma factor (sigma-70 family)
MDIGMIESKFPKSRASVLNYIKSKVSDPDAAEDILQDSLLKVLRSAPEVRDQERMIPWFYRIINNAIIDYYRHRNVESKYMDRDTEAEELGFETAERGALCACLREVIPTLKPEYAELIEEMELNEEADADEIARLGITRNNLRARRHRARTQLRQRLEETCRSCATHGCLDCSCKRS